MRRFLLRNVSLYTRDLLHHSSSSTTARLAVSRFRLFSSDDKPLTVEKPSPAPSIKDSAPLEMEDVDNKEFKAMIDKYLNGDEQMLPAIMEAFEKRRLSGKHEDTDNEWMEPIDDVDDYTKWDDTVEDGFLPDDIIQKMKTKFKELAEMCGRGELEQKAAHLEFNMFKNELVMEYWKKVQEEEA